MQRLGVLQAPQRARPVDLRPALLAANLCACAREGVRMRDYRGRYAQSRNLC